MKIYKYKCLNNNKYKLFIDDEEIILYEDIIIKYGIILKKDIDKKELEKYILENNYYDGYYKALKYINYRIRSEKEITDYLRKNNIDEKSTKSIVEKLVQEGYINDNNFCKSFIHDSILMNNDGPLKIKKKLQNLGVPNNVIEDNLSNYKKEDQIKKINNYINKQIKLNKTKSLYALRKKLMSNLISMGFYMEDIKVFLNDIKIDDQNIKKKEYEKIYNQLKNKYNGYELEQKIKQKMFSKGFYK